MASGQKCIPLYQDVDGFRIPGFFSADAYRSAIEYKPRPDDLLIVTYPKCGTTWVQNIVAGIFKKGEPFKSALEFLTQTPFLELTGASAAETMKRPGAIKLHLPFRLTPYSPEAKYIFVARNPKDCCVSFYHHTKSILGYQYVDGEFDDYFELFIKGEVDFGDYFDTLLSWYEHRNDPNVLFITYEQLKKNTSAVVLEISGFIGPEYREELENNPELLEKVIKHSSFGYMKEKLNEHFAELSSLPPEQIVNNPDLPEGIRKAFSSKDAVFNSDASSVNFVRKGIVGDWRNHFSEEQNKRLEEKYRMRTQGTDIPKFWENCM